MQQVQAAARAAARAAADAEEARRAARGAARGPAASAPSAAILQSRQPWEVAAIAVPEQDAATARRRAAAAVAEENRRLAAAAAARRLQECADAREAERRQVYAEVRAVWAGGCVSRDRVFRRPSNSGRAVACKLCEARPPQNPTELSAGRPYGPCISGAVAYLGQSSTALHNKRMNDARGRMPAGLTEQPFHQRAL